MSYVRDLPKSPWVKHKKIPSSISALSACGLVLYSSSPFQRRAQLFLEPNIRREATSWGGWPYGSPKSIGLLQYDANGGVVEISVNFLPRRAFLHCQNSQFFISKRRLEACRGITLATWYTRHCASNNSRNLVDFGGSQWLGPQLILKMVLT